MDVTMNKSKTTGIVYTKVLTGYLGELTFFIVPAVFLQNYNQQDYFYCEEKPIVFGSPLCLISGTQPSSFITTQLVQTWAIVIVFARKTCNILGGSC